MDQLSKHLGLTQNKVISVRLFDLEEPLPLEDFWIVVEFSKALVELGFSAEDISISYQNTNNINDLLLSVDWFSNTRSNSVEIFFDKKEGTGDIHILIRLLLTIAPNGLVNEKCYNIIRTFGPKKNIREVFTDFEIYENLRRCAHQIKYNRNELL